ncbi:IS66 family insertion sequence element accessory protein TnpB [Caballeronia sp. RCC_10]|uniref:IS66 family insertion sequence element accessory protein TnpB n=1 Tax=Caballeronia sp. RCC_10 TaxID=3239227 RepID=UPI003524B949
MRPATAARPNRLHRRLRHRRPARSESSCHEARYTLKGASIPTHTSRGDSVPDPMICPLANTRIWVAAGFTYMRCGFDGLAAKVQTVLAKDPFSGHIFVFRGKRGSLVT